MAEISYMDSLFNTNGDFKPKRKENFFTDIYFSVPSPTTKADLQKSSFLSTPTAPPANTTSHIGNAVAAGAEGAAGATGATGAEGGSSRSQTKRGGDYDYAKLFDVDHIGSTVQGIGSLVSGVAGITNASEQQKYQNKIFNLEKERVDKANARQETYQKNYENSKGW